MLYIYYPRTTHLAKPPHSLLQFERVEFIMVLYLDMRLCVVGLINLVKPPKFQTGGGGGVSCGVMTWSNLFTFVLVLPTFSFVSIKVLLTLTFLSTRSLHISLRFGNRPLFVVVSFIASLTSPRALIWYTYPVILLLFISPLIGLSSMLFVN